MKLINKVPRSTFTYLVEGYFAQGQTSLRNQVLGRYSGFLSGLKRSPSSETRILVNIVARDPSSNTADNVRYIEELAGISPWSQTSVKVKAALPVKEVPDKEKWRLGLLQSLLELRKEKNLHIEDTERVTAMLGSLCST